MDATERAGRRFLVELRPTTVSFDEVEAISRRAFAVALELAGRGLAIRFVRAVAVPEDGTCLLIWDGRSRLEVRAALRAMGRTSAAISESLDGARVAAS